MLNDETPYANRSTANGSATSFAYTFTIRTAAEIAVYVDTTLKTYLTHYTLTGIGVSGGGTVEFLSAPANATVVSRVRAQPASQLSDYIPNEAFPSERIELDLDKLAAQIQQIKEVIQRMYALPISSSLTNQGMDVPTVGLFARGKAGGGIDWATPTNAGPLSSPVGIADGGTGATSAAGARTNLLLYSENTLIDAAGDLLVGSADNTLARLAKGTDGDGLFTDALAAIGLSWRETRPISLAPNPFFMVDQLANSATSLADDT
jgi:hypothetical protein